MGKLLGGDSLYVVSLPKYWRGHILLIPPNLVEYDLFALYGLHDLI